MVLRVVDGGIGMVIGSTVGVVLGSGGDYGCRCGGCLGGDEFGLASASTCRHLY